MNRYAKTVKDAAHLYSSASIRARRGERWAVTSAAITALTASRPSSVGAMRASSLLISGSLAYPLRTNRTPWPAKSTLPRQPIFSNARPCGSDDPNPAQYHDVTYAEVGSGPPISASISPNLSVTASSSAARRSTRG
jgi:hypothetical protein